MISPDCNILHTVLHRINITINLPKAQASSFLSKSEGFPKALMYDEEYIAGQFEMCHLPCEIYISETNSYQSKK